MKMLRKVVLLSIRNHWMGFSFLLVLQWALGYFRGFFAELFGVVDRTIINAHKTLGWILFFSTVVLALEKYAISFLKIRRAPIHEPWTRRLVRHHWIFLLLLITAQLLTTVYVSEVASFLKVDKSVLTVWHKPIGLVILLFTIVLTATGLRYLTARGGGGKVD